METQTQTYDDVSQHDSLSLHTKLEGACEVHRLQIAFLFPMEWPLDGFQGPILITAFGLYVK